MKKFLGFIKRNIFLIIMSLFVLTGITIILIVTFKFFILGNNEYGNRLDGIEKVKITNKEMTTIESTIKEHEMVKDANVRIQGKIVYITIEYNDEVNLDQAKQVANSTLEKFSEEELAFYDLGYFLTNKAENGFNITGSKKAKRESISFIRS